MDNLIDFSEQPSFFTMPEQDEQQLYPHIRAQQGLAQVASLDSMSTHEHEQLLHDALTQENME